jgi:hypothetical protein
MLRTAEISRQLRMRPFQPLRVYLIDGTSIAIGSHREACRTDDGLIAAIGSRQPRLIRFAEIDRIEVSSSAACPKGDTEWSVP